MNRKLSRWLYEKAAEALGEEELESLKSDLITPVKIALKDAIDDYLEKDDENIPLDWENISFQLWWINLLWLQTLVQETFFNMPVLWSEMKGSKYDSHHIDELKMMCLFFGDWN